MSDNNKSSIPTRSTRAASQAAAANRSRIARSSTASSSSSAATDPKTTTGGASRLARAVARSSSSVPAKKPTPGAASSSTKPTATAETSDTATEPDPKESKITAINEILKEAVKKYKPDITCWNEACKAKDSLTFCGFNQKTGLRIVKCKYCNKQTVNIADVIYKNVGVKLNFEGQELTSAPTQQDQINATLKNTNSPSSTEEQPNTPNSAQIADLLASNKQLTEANQAMATEVAKLNAQLAAQSKTIETLSQSIAALTQKATSNESNQTPLPKNNQVEDEDTAAPVAPEGPVARREIPQGPAGNAESQNKEKPNPKPPKTSWADIAKSKRPAINALSEKEQSLFKETTKNLAALGFKPVTIQRRRQAPSGTESAANNDKAVEKPKPVPVYFGGLPRGPIGKLRAELRKCLPKWSILHLSFIGNSATEILCHEHLVDKLVGGMKLLGFRHIANFDPLQKKNTDDATLRGRVNCYNRWRWGAETSYSEVSREWFKTKMETLAKESPEVKEAADEKHSSNAAKKSAEKESEKQPEKATDAPAPEQNETETPSGEAQMEAIQVPDEPAPQGDKPAETTDDQQRPEGETDQ